MRKAVPLHTEKDWKGSDMKSVGILFLFVLKKRDSNND